MKKANGAQDDAARADPYEAIRQCEHAAEVVHSCWPRLGAIGPTGLTRLNMVLEYLDGSAARAAAVLPADPRLAAMILMMCLEHVYECLAPDPEITDSPLPAAGRVLKLLNKALRDLDCGKPSELFTPVNKRGASRLSHDEEEKRCWAAVALELRARRTGKTRAVAGKEIGRELGIPREELHVVEQWRKDIVSGKRDAYWKHEFESAVDPCSFGVQQLGAAQFEESAIKWAKEAAENDLLGRVDTPAASRER